MLCGVVACDGGCGRDTLQADEHGMTPGQHCILMRKGDWERTRDHFMRILDPLDAEEQRANSRRKSRAGTRKSIKSAKSGASAKGKKQRT